MSTYYLIATLPLFDLDGPPPMTSKAYLALCREQLAETDAARVEQVLSSDLAAGASGGTDFTSRWQARETQLRNAAARIRAGRMRQEAGPFLREHAGIDATLDKAVAEALGKESPLDREVSLDKLRWGIIEELAGTDPFSIDAVLAYALKLRLAERWSAMSEDEGQERVRELLADRMATHEDNETLKD